MATWRRDVGEKAKDDVKEADGWFFSRVLFIHERHSFWDSDALKSRYRCNKVVTFSCQMYSYNSLLALISLFLN